MDSPPDHAALPVVTDGPALFAELAQGAKPLGYAFAGMVHYGNADALERDRRNAPTIRYGGRSRRSARCSLSCATVARAIRCPFAAEHASAKGKRARRDSSTAYLPRPPRAATVRALSVAYTRVAPGARKRILRPRWASSSPPIRLSNSRRFHKFPKFHVP